MLSSKRREIAKNVGVAVAYNHFIFMLNPRYRGPKFAWDDLYPIVSEHTQIHVEQVGDFGRDRKEMREVALQWAKYTLDTCFMESEVKKWLPV